MKFEPQNDYLLIKIEKMPNRGRFTVPLADKCYSIGRVVSGDIRCEGKGVLFNNLGRSYVWPNNEKHCFIKRDEIISFWDE